MADRHGTLVGLLAVALLAGAAGEATARAKPGAAGAAAERTALPPAPAPVRFFTINQVLAKRDSAIAARPLAAIEDWPLRLASLGPSDTLNDAAPRARAARLHGAEPFGLFTFRAPEGILWTKWRGVEAEITSELASVAACRAQPDRCAPGAARFVSIVEAAKAREGRARYDEVNRAVNDAVRYVSDAALHGMADRWSAPLATLAGAAGDCEDYAIAKYVALREAGTPAADMRLLLVRDRTLRQDHAVLAVREGERWLVLDNLNSLLIEDERLKHYQPLFALDHDGVKLFAAPYAGLMPRRDAAD